MIKITLLNKYAGERAPGRTASGHSYVQCPQYAEFRRSIIIRDTGGASRSWKEGRCRPRQAPF